ncbi:MAG: envelope biogenesis factor ElyC [Deltaproteobacteria bacterium]|nr:envelope biogenesis factor ElyC [Deltaproteobacteria bacterium]
MFIIKKILGSVLMPLPFFLLISFVGLFLLWRGKRVFTGKILTTLGLIGLTIMSYNPVSRALNAPLNCKYEAYSTNQLKKIGTESETLVKYVVVLAGGHKSDPNIPVTSRISGHSMIRLVEGIRILRKNPGARLILSGGGAVDPVPEARVMAEISQFMGVSKDDMIIESASNDTKDQAWLIKPIVGTAPFVLVTSATHMPRSMALFQKMGMRPIPGPAGTTSRIKMPFSPWDIFPSVNSLVDTTEAVHEYLGLLWGQLKGRRFRWGIFKKAFQKVR